MLTPNPPSLMQLTVEFMQPVLTALVALSAGLLLRFRLNSAWLVLGRAVIA